MSRSATIRSDPILLLLRLRRNRPRSSSSLSISSTTTPIRLLNTSSNVKGVVEKNDEKVSFASPRVYYAKKKKRNNGKNRVLLSLRAIKEPEGMIRSDLEFSSSLYDVDVMSSYDDLRETSGNFTSSSSPSRGSRRLVF